VRIQKMKKASIIMAVLSCAIIAAAYTNSVPISTNTRAATEKWTAIRFEPALPPTPENAASKFLNGNREWQTAVDMQAVSNALAPYATTQQVEAAAAALAVHTNRADNPHGVTAAQIGAITNEQDLAALRTYHYGSPDIVESPAEWFVFDGAGTITAFNYSAGRENVVIPWEIGGVPVTAIGAGAFGESGIVSVIAPQTVKTIGDNAFYFCGSLTSVSLPQATAIGVYAFYYCTSLTSINLPQATTIYDYAFYGCSMLTSVHMGQNAPAEAAGVFAGITPLPTVYVTNPQATGWGAVWNGAPVVRPPLYGSNVTAQAFTLGGDTITEWPSGGGETSIIAPLIASGTNITVTSTQSVYSVSVTGAGPVGIDWSGLALDGTGRAEVTLRLNVTEWGGTNVTFAPSLTFDQTPEILVTGVWEFAASTIDGVTTRVRQTWPETGAWLRMQRTFGSSDVVGTWTGVSVGQTNVTFYVPAYNALCVVRHVANVVHNGTSATVWIMPMGQGNQAFDASKCVATNSITDASRTQFEFRAVVDFGAQDIRGVGLWTALTYGSIYLHYIRQESRPLNTNERAAYEAGWRP
jgi:hypothetical protein